MVSILTSPLVIILINNFNIELVKRIILLLRVNANSQKNHILFFI